MQTIVTNTKALSVLAAIHADGVLALIAVGGAMLAGGWLCMAALALH